MWQTSNLILRPMTKSSLKLKKSKWNSCRSFDRKEGWGMHLDVAVLKLISNESESAKKKCSFLDYFFFYRSLKLVHLHLFWLRLQYRYGARFTILTYLCIHCSQSFALDHYLVGSLYDRYFKTEVTKGVF